MVVVIFSIKVPDVVVIPLRVTLFSIQNSDKSEHDITKVYDDVLGSTISFVIGFMILI